MQFDAILTEILKVIVILSPILGPVAILLASKLLALLPANVRQELADVASSAAAVAEQTKAGAASVDKKATALDVMQRMCAEFKLPFDATIASDLIEVVVAGYNQVKLPVLQSAPVPVPVAPAPAPVAPAIPVVPPTVDASPAV